MINIKGCGGGNIDAEETPLACLLEDLCAEFSLMNAFLLGWKREGVLSRAGSGLHYNPQEKK